MTLRERGFTLIEILIALSVIAIAFVPMMQMFTAALVQTRLSEDLTTARFLGEEAMERVRNLSFTEAQLKERGEVWTPPLKEPPLFQNGKYWRVLQGVRSGSDPLEIRVRVYPAAAKGPVTDTKPLLEFGTLIEDLAWS